ncbi:ice-binding family protein [Pengzhenrongella sp.]|uniref:ice-binding family protein n=1 Tax=Pengzhenrongella sp. TaxID=2888820 RepID=UPI002F93D824
MAPGACVLLVLGLFGGVSSASAAVPRPAAPVNLGTAAGFSVLAGPSIGNTGAGTVLALDLGVSGTLAGFPPGTVTGTTHIADPAVETAQGDRQAAYDAVAAQTGGTAFAGDLAGTTFTPGLYTAAAAVTNTGTITLDAGGDPNALFVFQVGAALSSAAATKIVLAHGALAHNVYWQVVGAVSLGAGAKWFGTLLGASTVAFGEAASLKGRALTPSTVGLADSPITQPIDDLVAPVVAINGGPTASTNDGTPPISGTTDEPGTPLVTVTIGSQVLTARAADGAWTMSANALDAGTHDVVASVTDPSQNTGTATQVLTLDTSAPAVTITGGADAATNDTTPTISGTTDEVGTPTVAVSVGGQTLATTADAGGAWTVDSAHCPRRRTAWWRRSPTLPATPARAARF